MHTDGARRRASRILLSLFLVFAPVSFAVFAGGSKEAGKISIEITGSGTIPKNALLTAARRELAAFNSASGTAADIADAAYTMQLYLRGEGYATADIRFRFYLTDESGRRTYRDTIRNRNEANGVEFIVDTGAKYRMGTVRFSGNTAYDGEYLSRFFSFPKTGLFNTGQSIFTRKDLSTGVNGIEELYLLDGYYEVRVTTSDPVFSKEGLAEVTVLISEGARYLLGDQTIQSPDLNDDQIEVLRASLPERGKPFYVRLAAEGATSLRTTLGNWGFDAAISYDVDVSKKNDREGTASVSYTVKAGKPLVLSEYRVVNDAEKPLRTRESLIRSRFPFEPGDTLDRGRLNMGLSRLYSLGIFSTIALDLEPKEDTGRPLQPADLVIHVTESTGRFLEASAGWGTWEFLRGSLRYSDLNLFGLGRSWTLDLSGNFKGYGAGTSIQDRLLFGPASLLSLSAQYRYDVEPSFNLTEGDATLSLGYELGAFWRFDSSYTYTMSRADNTTAGIPGAEDALLTTGRFNLQAVRDTRDSALLPKTGYRALGSVTWSAPFLGSERDFLDYLLQSEVYIPLFSWGTFVLTAGFETKQILDDIPTLPIQERLFLGGDGSVRSFGRNLLGPSGAEGSPVGGLTALRAGAELRLKLWRELHAALFYDAGILSESSWSLDAPPGYGIGVGLRYYLPIGPVRLDAALNPGPLFADTNRWELHFAVGFSF